MRETITENGAVRGVACGWPSITAFYGIPYAAAPVGALRWRAPQPAENWEGVRDCARPSGKCPQPGLAPFYKHEFYPYEEEQTEDCLYLNIWTPARSAEEKLPVYFWIHGGAFMTGYGHSAHFNGEPFAKKGVILVTINYRLNIFGWMVHPELDAESETHTSGNYGLLDQLAALRWVRRNIAAFGGDPDNITVGGQSAGAMCVQSLLMAPASIGLFKGAVMQSGGGLMDLPEKPYRALTEAEAITAGALGRLGVSSIEEARKIPALELEKRFLSVPREEGVFQTQPVIDGTLLPEPFLAAADAGHYLHVPVVIGSNADDDPCSGFCDAAAAAAKDWAARNPGQTWVYFMDRKLPGDDMGAFHSADLLYTFKTLDRSWRPMTGDDYMLAERWNTAWCDFIKTGDPGWPSTEVHRFGV